MKEWWANLQSMGNIKNVNKGDPPMHTHGRELIVNIKNEEEKMSLML